MARKYIENHNKNIAGWAEQIEDLTVKFFCCCCLLDHTVKQVLENHPQKLNLKNLLAGRTNTLSFRQDLLPLSGIAEAEKGRKRKNKQKSMRVKIWNILCLYLLFLFPLSEGLDTLQSLKVRTSSAQSSLIIPKHIITADFIQINSFIILHGRSEAHATLNVSLPPFTFPYLFLEPLFNMVFVVMHASTLKKYFRIQNTQRKANLETLGHRNQLPQRGWKTKITPKMAMVKIELSILQEK